MPDVDLEDMAGGRLLEIAENLHRREISALERAELVAEWVQLRCGHADKLAQPAPVSKRGATEGRGNKGGDRQAARDLGVPRQTVERSKAIASLPAETKQAAKDPGIDDNQSALLAASKKCVAPRPGRYNQCSRHNRGLKTGDYMPSIPSTDPYSFVSSGPEKGELLIPQIVDGRYVAARSRFKIDKVMIPVGTPWSIIKAMGVGLRMIVASRTKGCGPRYISPASIRWP